MAKSTDPVAKKNRAAEELGEEELEQCAGGFNPQPEPPAELKSKSSQTTNPYTQKVRSFRGIG